MNLSVARIRQRYVATNQRWAVGYNIGRKSYRDKPSLVGTDNPMYNN